MARPHLLARSTFSQQVLAAVALCAPGCGGAATDDASQSAGTEHTTDNETDEDRDDGDDDRGPVDEDKTEDDEVTTTPDPIEPPLVACFEGTYELLDHLNPAREVDYLALASGSSETILEARHDSCQIGMGGAAQEECGTWRGPLIEPDAFLLDGHGFLVWSVGEEHGSITNKNELLAFLGTIDTVHEARLVLQVSQEGAQAVGSCADENGPYCFRYDAYSPQPFGNCETLTGWTDSYCVDSFGEISSVREEHTVTGQCLAGRKPEGLVCDGESARNFFVNLCRLETAAALAFGQLARELKALGAPASLIERAEQAAFDECEHSVMAAREARQTDPVFERAAVANVVKPQRSALELALENAEEGLVRESFGAAQAQLHARLAPTSRLRRFWSKIAGDELRHAELSRDMGQWLWSQLNEEEQQRVIERRQRAVANLARELGEAPMHAEVAKLGLPTPEQNKRLFERLRPALAA